MPFSELFSPLRHKSQTDISSPAAFLCPFQDFFLPLGINIFFISCERMLLLCHKILLINLLTSFVNSFRLFFTYFNKRIVVPGKAPGQIRGVFPHSCFPLFLYLISCTSYYDAAGYKFIITSFFVHINNPFWTAPDLNTKVPLLPQAPVQAQITHPAFSVLRPFPSPRRFRFL